jgi:hypothetical protein
MKNRVEPRNAGDKFEKPRQEIIAEEYERTVDE